MTLKLIDFPDRPATQDIPSALRLLAAQIQAGEFDDVHNLAWVIDCGDSRVEIGLMGHAPQPGATGHLLFSLAQHKMLTGTIG